MESKYISNCGSPTTFRFNSHLFTIDSDLTMNDKLPCLPYTASKQCSENCRVESSLNRSIGHMHIWDLILSKGYLVHLQRLLQTRTSPCSLFRAIMLCQ